MTAPATFHEVFTGTPHAPTTKSSRPRTLTLCAYRTLGMAPAEAEAAFAGWADELTAASPTRKGGFSLQVASGRLELQAVPLSGSSKGNRLSFTGRLRSPRGWITVPIQVELEPWSETETEMNIRPLGPVCLRHEGSRKFFEDNAGDVLETLARLVTSPAPLRIPAAAPAIVGTATRDVALAG